MSGMLTYLADNAANLLLNATFALSVYMIARLLKAGPSASIVFAAIPFGAILLLQNPAVPNRLIALLG
ncbi:MAG: hypothetical protein RLW68_05470 [Devosia marina]|uniref:Uncharacterized protein n=1 Tax=Devosia marina TaxID=2683198 RepID=A0A7X3FVV6_9HYPH|nr:hypothetical protein [Devosia marina]MVT00876.1 hypothetical protein [Devosia marina]